MSDDFVKWSRRVPELQGIPKPPTISMDRVRRIIVEEDNSHPDLGPEATSFVTDLSEW